MPLSEIPINLPSLRAKLASVAGTRMLMGQGSGAVWPNILNPGVDDMTATNGATFDGNAANFDGINDYFVTPGAATVAPAWATGFGGSVVDQASWNGSGITITAMVRIQPGDLVSRVWCNWGTNNPGLVPVVNDNTLWLVRINASGQLEFWNRYAIDGISNPPDQYLENPFSKPDRAFRIPVDLRNYDGNGRRLDDGKWHLFQFSRSTALNGYYEKKLIYIDGELVYDVGTGNAINGFSDFSQPISVGKAEPTTIVGDPAFGNFKGQIAMFAARNRFTLKDEMRAIWEAAATGIRPAVRFDADRFRFARHNRSLTDYT